MGILGEAVMHTISGKPSAYAIPGRNTEPLLSAPRLIQGPPRDDRDTSDFSPDITSGGAWYLQSFDKTGDMNTSHVGYLQVQLTVHTLPDRADTDADGLNDSEEVNLGADGFRTRPWTADTDADGVVDGLESNGWTWSGSTIVAYANGFKTDPARADTDRSMENRWTFWDTSDRGPPL